MANDRFSVPEVLFNPSDIGINQAGLPEAIVQTIEKCPPAFHRQLYGNIILAGGNTRLPGFAERLQKAVELLKPADYRLSVSLVDDPQNAAYRGLQLF